MKNVLMICGIVFAFALGYVLKSTNAPDADSALTLKKQADGILAYEHYYEAASTLLKDVDTTTKEGKDLLLAQKQIDDYLNNVVLVWPDICDQRDKLSDAIREFADNHPEFSGHRDHDIMAYVAKAGLNPNDLPCWAYAY